MNKRSRWKHKGRSESGGYFALPHAVTASPSYWALPARAVKLLCDLGAQYRGNNNGDLSAAWNVMRKRGWKSRDTLDNAEKDLVRAGMIELTRQGGLNRCNLYALTWHAIDECGGKLDVPPTRAPSGLWKRAHLSEKQNASPESVSAKPGFRSARARPHERKPGIRVSQAISRNCTSPESVHLYRLPSEARFSALTLSALD